MVGKFAFSFDRDTFHGHERTRQDALAAAERKLNGLEFIPEAIFVGKRVPTDPGTSGLAETVLKLMRRRMNESGADAASQQRLRVNEHQLAELDDALDRVIRAWMAKHDLEPGDSKVIAISEHPLPQPAMTRHLKVASEVSELGTTESAITLE
jgi:hypothetical protein